MPTEFSGAPKSLQPTTLQTQIQHLPFIDCIPFPSVRDRIISAGPVVDMDILKYDVMSMGFRCWGRRPWDVRAWEVPRVFAEKWWWLLDNDIIEMTNYWREEKGEEPLVWLGRKDN